MATAPYGIRLDAEERDELHALAKEAGVSLNDAMRHGARLYLAAISAPRTRRGRPPGTKEDRASTT